MTSYRIDAGSLTVKAHSPLHDVKTTWTKVSGTAIADADTLATTGVTASFVVDMTAFDAGDWLKNRKLRNDFQIEANPRATFELRAVRDVVRDGPTFTATAEGVIRWRGKEVVVTLAGQGKLDPVALEATASFGLDIRTLGLAAPKFLMIKMSNDVVIEVKLHGVPVPA